MRSLAGLVDGVNGLSGSALALTGTGSLLAAIAAADVLRRLGVDEPGPVVGSVSLLGVLGCLLFQPFGGVVVLQAYDDLGSTTLWPAVLLMSIAVLAWSTSDPAAPAPTLRRR